MREIDIETVFNEIAILFAIEFELDLIHGQIFRLIESAIGDMGEV